MQIKITSVMVNDQARALKFYTEVLGFEKAKDLPAGAFRYITLTAPEGVNGMELMLEPNANPVGKTFQEALYNSGIPFTAFFTDNLEKEAEKLKNLGVVFTMPPTKMDWGSMAIFDDTCGNLILLNQVG